MKHKLITTIILCLMTIPLMVNAQNLEVRISISKDSDLDKWLISYEFPEAVEAVSFEKTPHSFVESDWRIKTPGASIDLSLLQVNLNSPGNHLSILIERENDQFIRGFYTPFLNFSDGSTAIFVGHYLPVKLKTRGDWIPIQEAAIILTISPPETGKIAFNERNDFNKLRVSEKETMQYAYTGHLPIKTYEKFKMVLDPELPSWIRESFLKAIPEFYRYFESKTHAKLNFTPLFIINFRSSLDVPTQDGGAAYKQIAINFAGDGWNQNPEANVVNVLFLLAHEMAHLWNVQHWRFEDTNPLWMHEGGANYFARKAMLNFGYVSAAEDISYYKTQSENCIKILQNDAINNLPNRADKYVCGEVVFKLSALMTNNHTHLDVWNKLVATADSLTYSETDFIKTLHKASTNKNETIIIENALRSSSGDELEALIKKYMAPSIYK